MIFAATEEKWYLDPETGLETRYSHLGYSIRVREAKMPRVPNEILQCVFYLYPDETSAMNGERIGGTGFFVGVPSEADARWLHLYGITNSHVIREGGSPVIRLNTIDGRSEIVGLSESDWIDHPDGDDLAIWQAEGHGGYRVWAFKSTMLLTEKAVTDLEIGIGDETVVVGRFINHEGKQKNTPAVRFGNIAMMPGEPILQEYRGFLQESFVVESRSLPGYSGAPVFVHIPLLSPRLQKGLTSQEYQFLLGVDWGHNYILERVRDAGGKEHPDSWQVRSNSGMMNVVPAWQLAALLDRKEFVSHRKKKDDDLAKQKKNSNNVLDIEGPFTRSDFEDALRKVSRAKPPQRDGEKNQT